jgi:hypothetical protein
MYIQEQVMVGIARERMADAIRAADQRRATRSAGAPRFVRIRLGKTLVRLGCWLQGHPAPALSP